MSISHLFIAEDDLSARRSRSPLGHHLGRSDRAHVSRFTSAGVRARNAMVERRCEAFAKSTGERCQRISVRGSKHCCDHINTHEMLAVDTARRDRLERLAATACPSIRKRAIEQLRAADRRLLANQWVSDPRIAGERVTFNSGADRAAAIAWLVSIGFDPDKPSPISGRAWTPRCLDQSLFAARRRLKGTLDEEGGIKSVRCAHERDVKFFKKLEAAAP